MPIMTIFYDIDYVLEATSSEFQFLWEINHSKVSWTSENVSHMINIGIVDSRPINLKYRFCTINNKKIMVWELTSELADYRMAIEWLKEKCPAYRDRKFCDAMNFSHLLMA